MQDEFATALVLATIGAIPSVGALIRGSVWGAGPTVGLLLIGLAVAFLITGLRQKSTPQVPQATAIPRSVVDVTLLMKQMRRA